MRTTAAIACVERADPYYSVIMEAITESEIRASFVNCSQGEAKRVNVPRDLEAQPWPLLDFLGWRDPGAVDRSYLVVPLSDRLVGLTMRWTSRRQAFLRRSMCSLCYTNHGGSGVALMTARKAGPEGRQGTSAGIYICTDLACSLYLRGKRTPVLGARMEETMTLDEQVFRMMHNVEAFVRKLGVKLD
ncbi:FBP domain-containing protein [Saccharothrix isguenensis]